MSYFQTQSAQSNLQAASPAVERVFLRTVFAWMVLGVGVTAGIAAWFGSNKQVTDALQANPGWVFGAIIVQLGLVFALSFGINKISSGLASLLFMLYAGVTGVVFSIILQAYSSASIAFAFAGAVGVFGGMAAYGYVTKSDLTKFGPILFGALMDANHPAGVFVVIAIFQALVIFTAVGVGSNSRVTGVPKTA